MIRQEFRKLRSYNSGAYLRRIFHEAGLQAKFREAGYVRVLLSTEEVAHFLSGLLTLHPDDNYTPAARNGFENKYHCSFLDASTVASRTRIG
jgi:hypothetical protein